MTRYADPRRCPDCTAPIEPGVPACPTCGLPLHGPLAQELFVVLSRADVLVGRLRAAGRPEAVPAAAPATSHRPPAAPPRRRLGAASVPKILLTLGASCLLVAALVFLAYAWSVLGVGGRTAVLVGFTAVTAGLAAWTARLGLRAAAESLSLVALGLLTLDVFGARGSGWFGDLSTPAFLVVLGLLLALAACGGAVAVRRTPVERLTGAQLVATAGVALVGTGVAALDGVPRSVTLVLAVLSGAAATASARVLRLSVLLVGAAVVTALEWLALAGSAVDRVTAQPSVGQVWGRLEVWPSLAAAALVAALALLHRLPLWARVSALAVAVALLALALVAPVLDESPDARVGAALGLLVATAAAAWWLPARWRLVGALTQLVAGGVVALATLGLTASAVARLVGSSVPVWAGRATDRMPAWDGSWPTFGDASAGPGVLPSAWLLPLCVAGLAATAAALVREVPGVPALGRRRVRAALAAAATATGVLTAALYPVPVWLPAALLVAAALTGTAVWLRGQRGVVLVLGLVAAVAGCTAALHAVGPTAGALATTLLVTALVHLRARALAAAVSAGVLGALALAAQALTVGAVLDAPGAPVALAGLLLLGGLPLAAGAAPRDWWAAPAPAARLGLEAGAAVAAVPLAVAGAAAAPAGDASTWVSVYLTVAGSVLVAMSLLRADRRVLGWPGGALLAVASWVRLWDLGVHAPEAYTLPSAAALVVVGMARLGHAGRAGTLRALSPGLGLALVPSLLWSLADPAALRSLLLGVGCFALVLAGVRARWAAPVLWGATTGLVLVLRLAAPYIGAALPRWVLIGAAGAALIAMGVSWERRLADARHLTHYLRGLR